MHQIYTRAAIEFLFALMWVGVCPSSTLGSFNLTDIAQAPNRHCVSDGAGGEGAERMKRIILCLIIFNS
jgi:hypothetical protein